MNPAFLAFDVVARLNRVNVDIRALERQYGRSKGITPEDLVRVARDQDFKSRLKNITVAALAKDFPLPAIAVGRDGSYQVVLKLNVADARALLFDPQKKQSVEKTWDELDRELRGFIVLRHRQSRTGTVFGFRWFLQEMIKFKRVLAEVLLGSFVVQLFGLVTPLFTQVILDKVIVHRSLTTLDVLAIAFLALAGFELLLNISRNYIFIHTAHKLDAKLGARLFKHLLALPFRYFEARQVGTIAARVRELDTIREFITSKAVSVVVDLFFSLVFVAVMLLYSVPLTLVVLSFVAVIALIYVLITPELRRRLEHKFQMGASSNSYLVESITGIQTVKSLAVEGMMQNRWEDHLGHYVRSSFNLANIANISSAVSASLRQLMTIAILYLGVKAVLQGDLSIGQLIAFQMFAGQFSGPVLRLVNLWNEFQQALLSVSRLGGILNHPREISCSKAITLPQLEGALTLEQVGYSYHPEEPRVLDKVSVTIAAGMSVGIVGHSGSGKSTLAKLLQCLYQPSEGAIYIDGIDARHMNPVWLRYNIGVVLQENYLFSGTIRENIALAKPDASMELIIQAARIAGAHEFIARMPHGYETVVSERGTSLSGGQKQRIAIARALINAPRLLIFDEATSALDYESEQIIQQNMQKIRQGRTALFITHRLATVRDCDLILVLDQGRLVEVGRHEELLQQSGYYHHLYTRQELQ